MLNKKIKMQKSIETKQVADVVFEANKYKSQVYLKSGESKFNLKSLMGVFALKMEPNMEVLIETDGEDEQDALSQMVTIFE
ncbi:MAG: HPr family phosphocarrier protein [Hespellia sp.]|nr:HPr family phosphocarrier protein [Hespellia sp.]